MRHNAILLGSGDAKTGGGGSTIAEILRCSALGIITVQFDVVVCNNSPKIVPGLYEKIAQHNAEFGTNVIVRTINRARYPAADGESVIKGAQTQAEAQACVDIMNEFGADFFVQAGYMKRTVGALLRKKGINSHPGPIDSPEGLAGVDTKGLYGVYVQEAVLAHKYLYSAHTVHEVADGYDSGAILAWRPILVKTGDTAQSLFDRVQIVEKACLPFDIQRYAENIHSNDV